MSPVSYSDAVCRVVEQTILRYRMIEKGDAVLAGVSGGPDSVALLYILMLLSSRWNLRIGVAHLNHCLRGAEADADADFVTQLTTHLNVPCYQERTDVRQEYQAAHKTGIEDIARQIRYKFLDRVRHQHGYHKVALGHQSNDNAESVLMFLLRGSGLSGLSGIPPVRSGYIVRPLIRVAREDIMAFLKRHNIPFRTDTSNRNTDFLRNRIRHETIPRIQTCNPKIIETLNRLSNIVRSENEWIQDITCSLYQKALTDVSDYRRTFSIPILQSYPEAALRRIFRMAIEKIRGDLKRISFSHIEATIQMTMRPLCSGILTLPDGIRIHREAAHLSIVQKQPPQKGRHRENDEVLQPLYYEIFRPVSEKMTIVAPEIGMTLQFTELSVDSEKPEVHSSETSVQMDANTLTFPLILRNIRPGDRFTPFGTAGHQKLKKYFIDHKIARSARRQCPVLLSQDRIIWLVGHRICHEARITSTTRTILKIEITSLTTNFGNPDT